MAATTPVHSSAVTNTPLSGCHRHCLFILDFVICRAQGQSNYIQDDVLRVPRALADTGAGPSVITTEQINLLPRDASVTRDYIDANPNVCGPDGRTLTTDGHATIVFTLSGLACRHRFLVLEGAPMILLGNDFLHCRGATIHLSNKGPCSMTLLTTDDGREGHSVPVTTLSPGEEKPMALTLTEETALAPSTEAGEDLPPLNTRTVEQALVEGDLPPLNRPVFSTPIEPLDFSTDPKEPRVSTDGQQVAIDPIPEAPDPTTTNTRNGAPCLRSEECLLFTQEVVRIPKRCKATFSTKLPETFQSHLNSAVLVDRLPNRVGLEDPPLVEMRVETPTAEGTVYVTVWNTTNRDVTLPGFYAVASASI